MDARCVHQVQVGFSAALRVSVVAAGTGELSMKRPLLSQSSGSAGVLGSSGRIQSEGSGAGSPDRCTPVFQTVQRRRAPSTRSAGSCRSGCARWSSFDRMRFRCWRGVHIIACTKVCSYVLSYISSATFIRHSSAQGITY